MEMTTGWIILIVVAVIVIYILNVYNNLVRLKNQFENAFAQIEVQLKRRYDLIPNLVNTAKAYMEHEKETLEAVISARNDALAGLQALSQQGGEAALQHLVGAD